MNPTGKTHRRRSSNGAASDARRGSVLVVVLVLLSALMLLGFLFFTLASQERENARYFAASEKWYAAQLDADVLMNFALEQIIVGPDDDLVNSALWGGRYSLLANLVGDDAQPYSGAGVNVADAGLLSGGTGNGVPVVDQDRDSAADTGPGTDLDGDGINDQLAQNLAGWAATLTMAGTQVPPGSGVIDLRTAFAQPDVGYSYPDLNSPFLAYIGKEPLSDNRVIIPSFHRPQYLRGLFGPTPDLWRSEPAAKPYILTPHADRHILQFDYQTGTIADTGLLRFQGGATGPFFAGSYDYGTDAGGTASTTYSRPVEGYWEGNITTPVEHGYPVDADGDNINEAVLLDLDHSVEETPDGSQQFIPLYVITLYDLDGLLNLNAHGNLYGDAETLATNPFGGSGQFISKSNDGRRRHEVNPQYGLDGATSAAGAEYTDFFGHAPANSIELANMELWFILAGRADYDATGAIQQLYPGRWGEAERLEAAVSVPSPSAYDYPRPGEALSDEAIGTTADGGRGLAHADFSRKLFPFDPSGTNYSIRFPRPGHPEDHQGQGTYVGANGKSPLLRNIGNNAGGQPPGRVQTLSYTNYWLSNVVPANPDNYPGPLWALAQFQLGLNPALVTLTTTGVRTVGTVYGATGNTFRFVDDPGETLLDPELARNQVTDSIFGADETAFLHMDDTTRDSNGIVSRLLNLVPANFKEDVDAAERRRRYTTRSSNLKSYALSPALMRDWETRTETVPTPGVHPNSPIYGVFPPYFGADPGEGAPVPVDNVWRPEARGLLQQETPVRLNSGRIVRDQVKGLIRKLSANHVAASVIGADGRQRFLLRPLTPHPPYVATGSPRNLTSEALSVQLAPAGPPPRFGVPDYELDGSNADPTGATPEFTGFATNQINTPAKQEWHARRDRQNMARDIYTLLYVLADPDSTAAINPMLTDNASRTVYTDPQMREMAQFAVNLVDAMDPDDTITAFVYDKNLGNGYTNLDDAYSSANPLPYQPTTRSYEDPDRGIVFGVEAQQLAFSELMAVFFRRGPSDDSDFTYAELQNMTPRPVELNGGWSVVVEATEGGTGTAIPNAQARSLTIRRPTGSARTVPPGGHFTIGASGEGAPPNDAGVPSAEWWVDLSGTRTLIAPAAMDTTVPSNPLFFDSITVTNPDAEYYVNIYEPTNPHKDGAESTVTPAAVEWLDLGNQAYRDGIAKDSVFVTFRLRRRLNLNRDFAPQDGTATPAQEWDNPWIEVDAQVNVPLRFFDDGTAPEAQLTDVISTKRREPLSRSKSPTETTDDQGVRVIGQYRQNSLGGYHQGDLDNPSAVWQRHFDRSFASIADLMSVPLFGPTQLTAKIVPSSIGPAVGDKTAMALARFLFPDQEPRLVDSGAGPVQVWPVTGTPPAATGGNLWYRLLEFVEVPQKYGDSDGLPWFAHYGGPSPWGRDTKDDLRLREFGKINLNTLRHPHVLGGLLDDMRVFNLIPHDMTLPSNLSLPTANAETLADGTPRNWWHGLLMSRDGGFDPYTNANFGGANAILPGVPSAKPFLPLSAPPPAGATTTLIRDVFSQTLLRSMPGDDPLITPNPGRRSLLELGQATTGAGVLGSDAEFATRYRLLGKALNHGTTRSNTYIAFIACDFFEANEEAAGAYSIGAKIPADPSNPNEPRYRGVFVIDRTLALKLLEKQDLPPTEPAFVYPQGSLYRTYSFARELGSDGRPTPKFDWQELVTYRKIIKAQ